MEDCNNKILLAIDFKQQSVIALEYAIYFAQKTKADIDLLYVIEQSGLISKLFSSDENKQKLQNEALKLFNELTSKFEESSDIKLSTHLRYGKVYEQINLLAEEIHPKFIIMGKSEDDSIKKAFLGSNTLHVVKENQYPVMTIRGHDYLPNVHDDRDNIILPLDVTKDTTQKVNTAILFARYFQANIKVISILNGDSIANELQLLKQLNITKEKIKKAEIECTTEIIENPDEEPVDQLILDYAYENEAFLIIIMTQSEKHLSHYFLGSTAQEIINNSNIPVLSVLPWDEIKDKSVLNSFVDPLGVLK